MKLDKLFNVLVLAGASSSAGLLGCGGDDDEGGEGGEGAGGSAAGTGGSAAGTGGSAAGTGGSAAGTGGAAGDACEAKCGPNAAVDSWTDCGGCCCWLAAGSTSPAGPICGDEPCCTGRGR